VGVEKKISDHSEGRRKMMMRKRAFRFTLDLLALLFAASLWLYPPRSAAATRGTTLGQGNPAAHGVRDADLDALRAILRRAVESGALPGVSLLLAHKGEVIFKEGFGNLRVDQSIQIASSTKPITATMVLILVDSGRIGLDDPIEKYLPEFRGIKVGGRNQAKHPPTVRQLLSHTAGISGRYPHGRPTSGTLAEFVRTIAERGLLAEPGTLFQYSGVGMDVAARVAEVAGGMPFEDLVKRHIWEPLGMTGSSFTLGASPKTVPKAQGRYVSGGGGMSSTLDDMGAFYQMHLNGGSYGSRQLLSPSIEAEMRKKQAENPRRKGLPFGYEYGLGLYRDRITIDGRALTFSHGGALGTMPWIDTDRDLVGVFFSQIQLGKVTSLIVQTQEKARQIIPAGKDEEVVRNVPIQEERAGRKNLEAFFRQMSAGSDKVSRNQFKKYLSERPIGERLKDRPGATDHLFDRLDIDKDGYLTLDEFNSISSLRRDGGGRAAPRQGGSLGNPTREPAGASSGPLAQ
jgi:CubicO group peptidase (beta-lactamase class C family)